MAEAKASAGDKTTVPRHPDDLRGWSLLILLFVNLLLLLKLVGAELKEVDDLTKILGLGGIGAFFHLLRRKLESALGRWQAVLLVIFGLLLLLNLPIYGVSLSVNPPDATLTLDETREIQSDDKEKEITKSAHIRVLWLNLRNHDFKIERKEFDKVETGFSGWETFFRFWGLREPSKIVLTKKYSVEMGIPLPDHTFWLTVDPGPEGAQKEGPHEDAHPISLAGGSHRLLIETDKEVYCKPVKVPDDKSPIIIQAKDRIESKVKCES